jgi:hypothetical protein
VTEYVCDPIKRLIRISGGRHFAQKTNLPVKTMFLLLNVGTFELFSYYICLGMTEEEKEAVYDILWASWECHEACKTIQESKLQIGELRTREGTDAELIAQGEWWRDNMFFKHITQRDVYAQHFSKPPHKHEKTTSTFLRPVQLLLILQMKTKILR